MTNPLYRILLVGAGQLGSRYLQGLSKTSKNFQILVVDPNPDALSLARRRFDQMPVNPNVQSVMCHQDITELKGEFDLAIIATNADVRKKVVESLLSSNKIKYLILEKVVFQSTHDFEKIIQLLTSNKINAWVNCPRRIVPFFRKLRREISKQYIIRMIIRGSNWGLASNTIHMLDLLSFLSDQLEFLFDISQLDNRLYDSKRTGFIELGGKLVAESSRGDRVELYDDKKKKDPLKFIIEYNGKQLDIDQKMGIVRTSLKDGSWSDESEFTMPMQSEITDGVVRQILENATSYLTPLEESFILHRPMLKAFNQHLSNVLQKPVAVCPIT